MLLRLYESIFPNKNPEGNKPMKNRCDKSLKEWFAWSFRKFTPPVFFFLGLCLAVAGVSKAEPPLPDVWTGNPKSATEIYFVSDWFCPYCKLVEPGLAKMVANLGRDNKITFVDLPIHQESFNYIPAHISLLLNYKSQYMAGRKVLSGLASLKITAPDESVIAAEMKKAGIVGYKTADFFSISRVAAAYGNFIKSSGASTTPSILVRNSKTGKKKLLPGAGAFKEIVIAQAIREVNS
jgi:protein-disulfide isomerase